MLRKTMSATRYTWNTAVVSTLPMGRPISLDPCFPLSCPCCVPLVCGMPPEVCCFALLFAWPVLLHSFFLRQYCEYSADPSKCYEWMQVHLPAHYARLVEQSEPTLTCSCNDSSSSSSSPPPCFLVSWRAVGTAQCGREEAITRWQSTSKGKEEGAITHSAPPLSQSITSLSPR